MTTNKRVSLLKLMGTLLLMMICGLSANAQFLRTSYFMEDTHYRMQLNPALTPTRGYFNLPVIGAMNATVSSTSLSYQDIIDIMDDGDNFYSNPKFLDRLKDNNRMNVNFSTEILSAGWHKGKNFWSVNIGVRTDIGANLTKSMFTFLNEMDAIEDNWRNSTYDISNQQLNINAYTEAGVGLSRQINNRLTVGAKVKVLLGIGDMELKMNKVAMSANLPNDRRISELQNLRIEDVNSEAEVNKLRDEINGYHTNLGIDARLESSFKGLSFNGMEENGYIDDMKFESKEMGIAGYGFGIDLGASYRLLDNLTVSASILDLGFISWAKNSTQIATAYAADIDMKGSDYTQGIPTNPADIIRDPEGTLAIIQKNIGRLQSDANGYMDRVSGGDVLDYNMLQLRAEEAGKSRTSRLASTFVVGAEYGVFHNKLALGILSTTRFVQPKVLSEVTLSANYCPKSWLNAAISYSMIQSAGKSFGLAVKVGPLFVGTDYMFLGKNSNSVSGFLGISIPLGGKKASSSPCAL